MPRWTHSRPEVRRALDEANAAGLMVVPTTSHGHSWGYVDCTDPDCRDPLRRRLYVHSTPRNQDNEANAIRRFIRRHEHEGSVQPPSAPSSAARRPDEGTGAVAQPET
jgi:hypothetical protein